ncbi:MAG: hypothetical protein P4L69_19470 [Desulfosporosinus sp.]|nr:hypothetical protein [Desulfosporosinus sp.]
MNHPGKPHVLVLGGNFAGLAFKEMYYRTGGKPSRWGLPLTELLTEHLL